MSMYKNGCTLMYCAPRWPNDKPTTISQRKQHSRYIRLNAAVKLAESRGNKNTAWCNLLTDPKEMALSSYQLQKKKKNNIYIHVLELSGGSRTSTQRLQNGPSETPEKFKVPLPIEMHTITCEKILGRIPKTPVAPEKRVMERLQ